MSPSFPRVTPPPADFDGIRKRPQQALGPNGTTITTTTTVEGHPHPHAHAHAGAVAGATGTTRKNMTDYLGDAASVEGTYARGIATLGMYGLYQYVMALVITLTCAATIGDHFESVVLGSTLFTAIAFFFASGGARSPRSSRPRPRAPWRTTSASSPFSSVSAASGSPSSSSHCSWAAPSAATQTARASSGRRGRRAPRSYPRTSRTSSSTVSASAGCRVCSAGTRS
jgi:hypothetical protein